MLREFVEANREEILNRARARVLLRDGSTASEIELTQGLPTFLDQLCEALRKASASELLDHAAISSTATQHGLELFQRGLTIAQVVLDYGDICQVITGLAVETRYTIPVGEFQTLNLCLDDAIAGAVTAYSRRAISEEGTERLGVLAHEMRNVLNVAILSFASIKMGVVAPGGSTSAMHDQSLLKLSKLIDNSFAEVRLDAGMQNLERLPVCEVIEEVEVGASMIAHTRGLHLTVTSVDANVIVLGDRQILSAAIANLLQNAFKFTAPASTIFLRASSTESRVLIEVEDRCGGLPLEKQQNLLKPFIQKDKDRTGLGLGLSICRRAVTAMAGELRIRDLPGQGCIFTIDLPKQAPLARPRAA